MPRGDRTMSLHLRTFGSYVAGGTTMTVDGEPSRSIQFTPSTAYDYNPNGTRAIEHAYVQYFVPMDRNNAPPVVLVHGGGMTGAMWDTTPDGRDGWLQGLIARGYEVHVVDNVERGRAGWVPDHWPGEPVLRTLEEAWRLFRFGRLEDFASRTPFAGQQFPVFQLETFARSFVPRWTSTNDAQAAALGAVLDRVGQAILVCHSQGSQAAFSASVMSPERVAVVVAIEPSDLPETPDSLAGVPILIAHGDYLDVDDVWRDLHARWTRFGGSAADGGGTATLLNLSASRPGTSHMPMMDRSSADNLDDILARV